MKEPCEIQLCSSKEAMNRRGSYSGLTQKLRHPASVTQTSPMLQGQNPSVHRGCLQRFVRPRHTDETTQVPVDDHVLWPNPPVSALSHREDEGRRRARSIIWSSLIWVVKYRLSYQNDKAPLPSLNQWTDGEGEHFSVPLDWGRHPPLELS